MKGRHPNGAEGCSPCHTVVIPAQCLFGFEEKPSDWTVLPGSQTGLSPISQRRWDLDYTCMRSVGASAIAHTSRAETLAEVGVWFTHSIYRASACFIIRNSLSLPVAL